MEMSVLKSKIEAILFSTSKAMQPIEIAELLGIEEETAQEALLDLMFDYASRDGALEIDDEDAINMSRILSRKFGLGVGISSGANLLAAAIAGKDGENIVTVFADDFKKYLSTDLKKKINKNNNLISTNIEILSIE